MKEQDFIRRWSVNGDDLQQSGIYDKAAEMLEDKKVLEIGCGTGHSTQILLLHGCKVFAIDKVPDCIEETSKRVGDIGCEIVNTIRWSDEEATLMCTSFTREVVDDIRGLGVDAIILWNPGQDDKKNLKHQCAIIASYYNIAFQLMDRVQTKEEAVECLDEITKYPKVRLKLKKKTILPIDWNNVEGIPLVDLEETRIYEAIGLYEPL